MLNLQPPLEYTKEINDYKSLIKTLAVGMCNCYRVLRRSTFQHLTIVYLYININTRNEDNNMEHYPCSLATPPGIIILPNVWMPFAIVILGFLLNLQSLRSYHVVNSNKISNLLICQFNPSGDCERMRSTTLKLLPLRLTELLVIKFNCLF